jgi:hypothetical protein
LPAVLEPIYVGSWVVLTTVRVRDPKARAAWFAGLREGISTPPGERRPIKWKTVWEMSKAGRPPVV